MAESLDLRWAGKSERGQSCQKTFWSDQGQYSRSSSFLAAHICCWLVPTVLLDEDKIDDWV